MPCEIVATSDYDLVAAAMAKETDSWECGRDSVKHLSDPATPTPDPQIACPPTPLERRRAATDRVQRAQPAHDAAAGAVDRVVRGHGVRLVSAPRTVIFIVAAATDWLDGYWARKYGQVTAWAGFSTRSSTRSSSAARLSSWPPRPARGIGRLDGRRRGRTAKCWSRPCAASSSSKAAIFRPTCRGKLKMLLPVRRRRA